MYISSYQSVGQDIGVLLHLGHVVGMHVCIGGMVVIDISTHLGRHLVVGIGRGVYEECTNAI